MKDYLNLAIIHKSKAAISLLLGTVSFAPNLYAAQEVPDFNHLYIGAGAQTFSGLYYERDPEVNPAPIADIRFGNFYIRANLESTDPVVGFELLKNDSVSLSIAGVQGTNHFDPDDIDGAMNRYLGIEEREAALEWGFIGRYHSPAGLIEWQYLRDASSTHEGKRSRIKISNPLSVVGDWTVVPGFIVTYYSSHYNNYYYGVSREENERGAELAGRSLEVFERDIRPVYEVGSTWHVGLDLLIQYAFTESLLASLYVSYEDITGPIEHSPLVSDKTITQATAGLMFRF